MRHRLAASCSIAASLVLAGCTASDTASPSVSISPGNGGSLLAVTSPTVFTATVTGSAGPVSWSLTGAGSLSGTSGPRVTYRPPAVPGAGQAATVHAAVPGASASVSLQAGPAALAPARITTLTAPATVVYDEREIPHVTCAAANDCYAVQGWLHARDRLFQLDFSRRAVAGTLSELIGPAGLDQDLQIRTFFTTRAGEHLGTALRRALEADAATDGAVTAYLSGVNAYLASLRASDGPLPGEYAQLLLPIAAGDIPDMTKEELLSILRYQQYDLSGPFASEIGNGRFAAAYGPGAPLENLGKLDVWIRTAQPSTETSHTLTPTVPAALPPLVAGALAPPALSAWAAPLGQLRAAFGAGPGPLGLPRGRAGSNDWVVDAAHSASGHALVADDPHLSLNYPPNFYLATLTSTNPADHLDVTGGAFPGTPGADVGRGKSVGWGVTVVGYDVTDFYLEQAATCPTGVPPNTAFCVSFKGAASPVLAYPVTFRVRVGPGAAGLVDAVAAGLLTRAQSTVYVVPHHGPVVQAPDAGGRAVSVRWTGHEDWTNDIKAFLGLNTATDVDAAMVAIESWSTGAQNFVLGDEGGNIAYYPHALLPIRQFADAVTPVAKHLPWFPLPGTGAAEWGTGVAADNCAGTAAAGTRPAAACWIPSAQLPQGGGVGKNPSKGYFITANADPLGVSDGNPQLPVDSNGHYLSYVWDDSTAFRHARITERLSAALAAGGGKVGEAEMEAIQSDHASRLGAAFQAVVAAIPDQADLPDFQLAKGLLAQWRADGFNCPTGLLGTDPETSLVDPSPIRTTDAAACHLMHLFVRTLLQNVFTDDLAVAGLSLADGGAIEQAVKGMLHMLENPGGADQSFCDDVDAAGSVSASHGCAEQAVTALVTAFEVLAAQHGDPIAGGWAWGRVHTFQPRSLFPLVTTGYEPGPFARPGGAYTVDVGDPDLSAAGPGFAFGSSANVRHVSVMDPAAPRVRMQLPGPERDLPAGTLLGPDLLGEWISNTYFDYAHGTGQSQAAAVTTQAFHPVSETAMTTSRLLAAASLLLGAVACQPSIEQVAAPASVVTAIFDPATSAIPLPNDLALSPAGLAGLPAGAQKDLLEAFAAAGGFPNDQEVAITIAFAEDTIHADGSTTRARPALDLASFGPDTFFVYGITASGAGEVALDPIQPGDYATAGDTGVLTLHHKGRQPWAPGQYFAFVRGGSFGVRTTGGAPVHPSQVFFLMEQGQDMTTEQNLSILRAQYGTEQALALAEQLNALSAGYAQPFAVADTRFPHQELAVLTTFAIAPAVTQVELDPGRGLVPLPIDLLRDPRPASAACAECGHLTAAGACGLAGGSLDEATGVCSSPAAAGFRSLDGFGTTAPLLIGMSDLIRAGTVKTAPTASATVLLYELAGGGPVLVDPASYVTEPVEYTESGLSPLIALLPAGASGGDATSPFRTRPLKADTSYAVVIGDGVKDKAGRAIGPGTVARILLFGHPVSIGGVSQLQGIDDATAFGLEAMRLQLVPVLAKASSDAGLTTAHVAMAYTFKTQSIHEVALSLSAAPYAVEQGAGQAIFALTGAAPHTTPVAPVPTPSVEAFFDVTFNGVDAIDKTTGALRPTLAADLANPAVLPTLLTSLKGLVAVPRAAQVPFCAGTSGPRCAKVVVVGHGLGGSRQALLAMADALAAQGMIAVATDLPLHGSRAWCASSAQCGAGGTCTPFPGGAGQGDQLPPGTCTVGAPIPQISGQYFVSANFFRTRDALRQNLLDQSALVLAMARPPAPWPQPAQDVRALLLPAGVVIDPSQVRYQGSSLGAIAGTSVVATNPRFTGAVLNAGGATLTDVFTTSPAFQSGIDALLAGLGIGPGTSAYVQLLAVAKTVLDPADPANFAGHLVGAPLPDLLADPSGATAQAPKAVLAQAALCDDVVPNPWNYLLAANAGVGPLPGSAGFGSGTGTFQLFLKGAPPADIAGAISTCGSPSGTSPYAVSNGFLADFADPAITGKAQGDAAAFLGAGTLPPSLVDLP